MNMGSIESQRRRLAAEAARRYTERAKPREPTLEVVEKDGVFQAAGPVSSVRRAAHMTLTEGFGVTPTRPVAEARGAATAKNFEAIIGADDSDPINFLARGERARRAVCRLVVDGQPVGTGFLVAPGLLMTNNHVIGSRDEASQFLAEF